MSTGMLMRRSALLLVSMLMLAVAGCSSVSLYPGDASAKRGGGYYMDDGPEANPPADLDKVPDAVPRIEEFKASTLRPYDVLGKTYTPITDDRAYRERGIGSWYGKKYHGQKTSSGEIYNMYQMTAAHPTLPIPSYVRVRNLKNGRQVIVRVNDRGPFLSNRVIDLSYVAAYKLDYLGSGSAELEVERITNDEIRGMLAAGTGSGVVIESVDAGSGVQVQEITPGPVASNTSSQVAPVATSAAAMATGTGFYLQFGAFSKRENADNARATLLPKLAGLVHHLDVMEVNGMYRLFSQRFANRADALSAVGEIQDRGLGTAYIVER